MKKIKLTAMLIGMLCSISFAMPVLAEQWVDLEKTTGEQLFGEKCGMCHRANGMGTGILARRNTPELALLENRRDLQPAFIENVVRSGFRIMFPMSRGEVSDEQLKKIVSHLIRENGK